MTLSSEFSTVWLEACVDAVGYELPVNYLDFDEDTEVGEIGYEVADSDAPLELLSGQIVRIFVVRYKYANVKRSPRNEFC